MPDDDQTSTAPTPAVVAGRASPPGPTAAAVPPVPSAGLSAGPPAGPAGGAEHVEDPAEASTGDAAVDEALRRLPELGQLPVRDHVAVLDAVHAALQDRLADVED